MLEITPKTQQWHFYKFWFQELFKTTFVCEILDKQDHQLCSWFAKKTSNYKQVVITNTKANYKKCLLKENQELAEFIDHWEC